MPDYSEANGCSPGLPAGPRSCSPEMQGVESESRTLGSGYDLPGRQVFCITAHSGAGEDSQTAAPIANACVPTKSHASPDDFHSAWEPSDSAWEPKPLLDKDNTSVFSDCTTQQSGYDTDRSHRTNTSNQNQKCNRGSHPINAKKEEDKHTGKVVLSLFWDSPKEGAFTYTDWCREVEEYLHKGYDDNWVKDAMLWRPGLCQLPILWWRKELYSCPEPKGDGWDLQCLKHLPGPERPYVWVETGKQWKN